MYAIYHVIKPAEFTLETDMVGSIAFGQLSSCVFTAKINTNQFVYVSFVPIKVYLHQHKQQLRITKWKQLQRAKFHCEQSWQRDKVLPIILYNR